MTEKTCICHQTPKTRAAVFFNKAGQIVHHYHLDCPVHGIEKGSFYPVKEIVRREWLTVAQAWIACQKEGARLLAKSANKLTAYIEWIEYEREPEHA